MHTKKNLKNKKIKYSKERKRKNKRRKEHETHPHRDTSTKTAHLPCYKTAFPMEADKSGTLTHVVFVL